MSGDKEVALGLGEVRDKIESAARRSGRSAADLTLVAVSKLHPVEKVLAAAMAGQRDFGENYAQEALEKMDLAREREPRLAGELRWHFIGRLQSNKAKYLVGRFHLLHSLDSAKLARTLHKRLLAEQAPRMRVLVQVNLVGEERKGGVAAGDLPGLAEEIAGLESIDLTGLMFMPPFEAPPEDRRPLFARVRELRDSLAERLGAALPVLSMGMSDDFEQAIAEGATHIRVGTAIFGERPGG
jgi:hypothetical protein